MVSGVDVPLATDVAEQLPHEDGGSNTYNSVFRLGQLHLQQQLQETATCANTSLDLLFLLHLDSALMIGFPGLPDTNLTWHLYHYAIDRQFCLLLFRHLYNSGSSSKTMDRPHHMTIVHAC